MVQLSLLQRGRPAAGWLQSSPARFPRRAFRALAPVQASSAGSRWPHSAGVAVVSAPGVTNGVAKPQNQDSFIVEPVHPGPAVAATLIGVFDGHGREGHLASRHVSRQVATAVHAYARQALQSSAQPLQSWEGDFFSNSNLSAPAALATEALQEFDLDAARSCLEQSFMAAAQTVEAAGGCDMSRSGSTAVVCMVLPDSVVAAWAGDSRAVLGTLDGSEYYVTHTQDHKPGRLQEMARILAAGGKVMRSGSDKRGHPTGPFRVTLPGSTSAGLSVARAFGDLQLARAGVIPTPEVAVFPRTTPPPAADAPAPDAGRPAHVLVVASDGLWEQVGNQEAVEIAAAAGSAEEGAQRLLELARQRWAAQFGSRHADDVTVAVAYL